jgi:hypothetical protein
MNNSYCNKIYKWIYKKKTSSNDIISPFVKYIYISNKGDLIYFEDTENSEKDQKHDIKSLLPYLTKRRIDNDFAELTEFDLMYVSFETLTKNEIINTIDCVLNQKIKYMMIN